MPVYFFNLMKMEEEVIQRNYIKKGSRLDTGKYVFASRITDLWNSLPDACVKSTT